MSSTTTNPTPAADPKSAHAIPSQAQLEASRYALLLDWGSRAAVLLLLLSFFAYLFGLLAPHVPLDELPALWSLPVATYLARTATPTGWGWLTLAGKGDLANLIGIAVLAGCSLPALLGLIPLYLKRRDYAYVGICALIVIVLVLAASGIVSGGH